jgi:hypothetical protein
LTVGGGKLDESVDTTVPIVVDAVITLSRLSVSHRGNRAESKYRESQIEKSLFHKPSLDL